MQTAENNTLSEERFCVYLHKRKTDQKPFYVGKGTVRRACLMVRRNPYWQNVFAKHGCEVEIIASGLTEHEAFQIEKRLISELSNECDTLTNITDGGEGSSGHKWSESAKKRHSAKLKGNMPEGHGKWMSEENKRRWSDAGYREKVSNSLKGHTFTDAALRKMSKANKNRKLTDNAKLKTVQAIKERSACPEFRAKLASIKTTKEISCSNGMLFRSAYDAAEWLRQNGKPKAGSSPICACCNGRQKTAYGLEWRYTGKEGRLPINGDSFSRYAKDKHFNQA